jgi:hypothetical protein
MARIHVFAIDWVPGPEDIASGGGLRSLQVIEALRQAGHAVSFSVPRGSRAVQALQLAEPQRLRSLDLHDGANQIDLIREKRPELVLWLWPTVRQTPCSGLGDIGHLCDLNGLQDYEMANGSPALLAHARRLLGESCTGADMVLTGSPEQHGYWLARLGEAAGAPPAVLGGYALPPSLQGRVVAGVSRLKRVHFIGNVYSWSASTALLGRCAAWAAAKGDVRLHLIGGTDPGGATALADLRALQAIESSPAVDSQGESRFSAAMASFAPGSLALDLNENSIERQLAVPIRTVNALMHGVPILSTVDSPLLRRMARAGAAVLADAEGLEQALDQVAALPPKAFAAMSAAARRFAEQEFSFEVAAQAINGAAEAVLARRARQVQGWHAGTAKAAPLGQVLVISGEMPNLRELRVDLPLGMLQRRRLIGGYAVWDKGRLTYNTRSDNAEQSFEAIWVQRSVSAEVALVLDGMGLPFVYDIDDNLLVSPTYREAFAPESLQAARSFVRQATVLTCSTARLATLLQRYAATPVVHKTIVAQNLLRNPPPARTVGPPGCVVWASSDVPALTEGRLAVVKAVRDFCLTHGLRLVCVGAAPPNLVQESEVEVEHVGILPYSAYLELLRSLAPAILVCPLETSSDTATQDFVDGKSDIKILEAMATGLVGVFSAARAYSESDLLPPILCENSYRSWFEGLARARRACMEASPAPELPPWRLAGGLGTMPFFEALQRVRLAQPVHLAEITDRLSMIRDRLVRRILGPEEFDEDFYLARYPDVRSALESSKIVSAYDHYIRHGFGERRMAREGDVADGRMEQWWANLMHTMSDLKTSVDNRGPEIEELKTRRGMRLRLRQEHRR